MIINNNFRIREHANDLLKRKAAEATQSANDLRLRLDKLTSQFNDIQEVGFLFLNLFF